MNKLLIALILVCILIPVAAAQDTLWTRTYGGTETDIGRRIRCTSDGGFIVVGDTYSFGAGERDLLLYKMDANGDSVWSKVYGGAFNEIGLWVEETSDGGYIVSGRTETWGQSPINIWIMKTDSQGDSLWSKVYWKGGHYNFGSAICQFDDSSYVAACGQGPYSTLDIWLLKLDLNGDTLWTANYNPSGYWDEPYSMYKTAESEIIIGGLGFSMNLSWQGLVMKVDSTGNSIWTRFYGSNQDDRIYDVKQTLDGGFIATGYTTSFGAGDKDIWVLRMDSNGDTLWTKTYGGATADMGQEIFETYDGGFLLAGYTNSSGAGENDVWILNLDSSGDSLWTQTFGGTANDYALALDNTDKNEPVVVGHTESYGIGESDIYLLKLRADYCLECYTTNFTPRVRSGGGTLLWDLEVTNCGNKTVEVYGEIYPTIGDCATGYQFDLNLTRQITPFLPCGWTLIRSYYYDTPPVNPMLASLTTRVGTAVDDYIAEDCFEFFFAGPWYNNRNWGTGEWLEREGDGIQPLTTTLYSNYPNPFNASTDISFELARHANVNLDIFNIKGQKVETLVSGYIDAGHHSVAWDASTYSSGIYFYRLNAEGRTFTKRMTLLK